MTDSNITPPLAGTGASNNVAASDGKGAVGSVPTGLTLEQINARLGKEFKDLPTALDAIKDTFNFVGRRKEDIVNEVKATISTPPPSVDAGLVTEVKRIKDDLWFERNGQYKNTRPLIERLSTAYGGDLQKVVDSQEFKDVFTKAQGYDETQKTKTVLESSPRLKSSNTKMSQALDSQNKGKYEDTARLATEAVMEAYGMTE